MYLNRKTNSTWRSNVFDNVRETLNKELASFDHDPAYRLKMIQNGINMYSQDTSNKGSMIGFNYCLHAFLHVQKYGGLSGEDVEKVLEIAHNILQYQGVKPRGSRMSVHYGHLYSAMSQTLSKKGMVIQSAWYQQLATTSYSSSEQFRGYSLLVSGRRLLRVGEADYAIEKLLLSLKEFEPGSKFYTQAASSLALAYFLLDKREDLAAIAQDQGGGEESLNEVAWLNLWSECRAQKDYTKMMNTCKGKGAFAGSVYVLDAKLLSYCFKEPKWMNRLPKVSTLIVQKKAYSRHSGKMIMCLKILNDLHDNTLPLQVRLTSAQHLLNTSSETFSLLEEILVLGALTNWLKKSDLPELGLISQGKCQAISLQLTSGKDRDCLGILSSKA